MSLFFQRTPITLMYVGGVYGEACSGGRKFVDRVA